MQRLRLKFQNAIESGKWWPLAPFSFLWGLALFFRNAFLDRRRGEKIKCAIVSVGNIEVGGMGKTPLVLHLAQTFHHRKVAILSRGYGKIPDEALLLSQRLKCVKVYVGKDRVALAREAVRDGAELLILDDGFQYRRLYRDFDLVLIGEKEERYLPWGRLRDSPRRLKDADALFAWSPKSGCIRLKLVLKRIVNGRGEVLSSIKGKRIGAFCAIARPTRFKKTLESLGARITAEWVMADHEIPDPVRLEEFAKKVDLVLTTEKDYVKLPKSDLPIYYLEMETEVVSGRRQWESLIEKIDRTIDNNCL